MSSSVDRHVVKVGQVPYLVGIHLPVYVADAQRAYPLLGGERVVQDSIACDVDFLRLRFSTNDPLRQGLVGTRVGASGLLLRIKRKRRGGVDGKGEGTGKKAKVEGKGKDADNAKTDGCDAGQDAGDAGSAVTVETVGFTQAAYVFTERADYQFLPQSTVVGLAHEGALQGAQKDGGGGVLETIPRPFAITHKKMKDGSQAPLFVERTEKQERASEANPERRGQRMKMVSVVRVKYGDPVPAAREMPRTDVHRRRSSLEVVEVLHTKLEQLFARRKAYTKSALLQTGVFAGKETLLPDLLTTHAYLVESGPWKGLWVAFGYDPSKDPQARFLQVVYDMREVGSGQRDLLDAHAAAEAKLGCRRAPYLRVNLNDLSLWDVSARQKKNARMHAKDAELKQGLELYLFNVAFTTRMVCQVCDLMCPEALVCVNKASVLDECLHSSGWFAGRDLETLKTVMLDHFFARLDQWKACKLDMAPVDASAEGGSKLVARAMKPRAGPVFSPPSDLPNWNPCDAPPAASAGRSDWLERFTAGPTKAPTRLPGDNSCGVAEYLEEDDDEDDEGGEEGGRDGDALDRAVAGLPTGAIASARGASQEVGLDYLESVTGFALMDDEY